MENRDVEKLEPSLNHDDNFPMDSPVHGKVEAGASGSPISIQSSGTESDGEQEVTERPRPSRPVSVTPSILPAPVKVKRSARRGLFGRFTIVAEVEEPKHYERRTKWFITFTIALAAAAAPLGSAIFFRGFLSRLDFRDRCLTCMGR